MLIAADDSTSSRAPATDVNSLWITKQTRWVSVLLMVNLVSAIAFALTVDVPVNDEYYHLLDVHRYLEQGPTRDAIADHQNGAGPGSALWISFVGRLLGPSLFTFRLALILCWAAWGCWMLTRARDASARGLTGALLAALVFPHAMTATGTLLTEAPALVLAFTGIFVWCTRGHHTLHAGLAGFVVGLSIVCRQYYLAVLPALALPAFFELVQRRRPAWKPVLVAWVAAAVPILTVYSVWGGLSNPSLAAGKLYGGTILSKIGLSGVRPMAFLFILAVYSIPFGAAQSLRLGASPRWLLAVPVATFIVTWFAGWSWLGNGPILSAVVAVDARIGAGNLMMALLSGVGALSCVGWARAIAVEWRRSQSPLLTISAGIIVLFVLEQAGIGGTVPMFERYLLQLAPFIGYLSWKCWPEFSTLRMAGCVVMWTMGQAMIWRYAAI